MDSPYIAMIMMWAPSWAPQGWALCMGQQMLVQQNTALFSLIGVTYGGNGTSTFNLPNLCGRLPMGFGTGPGLTPRVMGQAAGVEAVTLGVPNLPAHAHAGDALSLHATTTQANAHTPTNESRIGAAVVPGGFQPTNANIYAPAGAGDVALAPGAIAGQTGVVGSGVPVHTLPPFLVVNFCIALQGLYPQRPD